MDFESMKPNEASLAQIGLALLIITVSTSMYNCIDCILILSNPNACQHNTVMISRTADTV